MPQISQIGEIYASQLFWLLIAFALIYFGIGKAMVPKIEKTVEDRDARISGDLAAAEAARKAADATEEAYRTRMEEARAAAIHETAAAKAKAALETEGKVKAADAVLATKAAEAEARLNAQRADALAGIEAVAAEAARDIVARISGVEVDPARAADAVKAVMAHG
jgi:F-type H+-transporting ATPase subunit b